MKNSLGAKFDLKNSFTKRGIRIKPAEKNSSRIEADVHTSLATETHPDYLEKFETGGEKIAWGGHTYIAVPTKYAHQIGGRIIRPELRIGTVMQNLGNAWPNTRSVKGMGFKRHATHSHALVFFLQTLKDGHRAVMCRYWDSRDPVPFYLLIEHAKIDARLTMEQTVVRAVQESFPAQWRETWKGIMARGLRVS